MTTTAQQTTMTVLYERKFSDGNYGSEGLSLAWTGAYGEDNDPLVVGAKYQQIADALRRQVLAALSTSASERVATMARRELNPPPPRQPAPVGAATTAGNLEEIPF